MNLWFVNMIMVNYTLWLFNIAMEHGPFIDGFPTFLMVIFHGYVKSPDGISLTYNVNPGLINPKRLFNWEGTIKKYQMT